MNYANNIKNLGMASMNELIGYTGPEKYPLINKIPTQEFVFLDIK